LQLTVGRGYDKITGRHAAVGVAQFEGIAAGVEGRQAAGTCAVYCLTAIGGAAVDQQVRLTAAADRYGSHTVGCTGRTYGVKLTATQIDGLRFIQKYTASAAAAVGIGYRDTVIARAHARSSLQTVQQVVAPVKGVAADPVDHYVQNTVFLSCTGRTGGSHHTDNRRLAYFQRHLCQFRKTVATAEVGINNGIAAGIAVGIEDGTVGIDILIKNHDGRIESTLYSGYRLIEVKSRLPVALVTGCQAGRIGSRRLNAGDGYRGQRAWDESADQRLVDDLRDGEGSRLSHGKYQLRQIS